MYNAQVLKWIQTSTTSKLNPELPNEENLEQHHWPLGEHYFFNLTLISDMFYINYIAVILGNGGTYTDVFHLQSN